MSTRRQSASSNPRKKKKRGKRPVAEYLDAARRLAKWAPGLKKYARRHKKLSTGEKAAIARKEKLLKYTDNLYPVSAKLARARKHELYVPDVFFIARDEKGNQIRMKKPGKGTQGIRAMQFRNTGKVEKIEAVGKDITLVSNGRVWTYQSIHQRKQFKQKLAETAEKAFDEPEQYPIERIAALAKRAFKRPKTKRIYLWTRHGRVGAGFEDLQQFIMWLEEEYAHYHDDPEAWVLGIAVLL